ncbi:MAG: DUF3987 domain-containing protein, partial [Verrucomicrobiota bacterium]
MPPLALEFARVLNGAIGIPLDMTLLSALSVLSAGVPRKVTFSGASNHGVVHGNVYVIISAPKGSGKSTIAEYLLRPLIEKGKRALEAFNAEKARYLAEMEKVTAALEVQKAETKEAYKKNKSLKKRTPKDPAKAAEQAVVEFEVEEEARELQSRKMRLEDLLEGCPMYIVGNHTTEALAA